MPSASLIRRELRALVRLAIPTVMAQIGMQAMGFVDMIMVGRLGPDAMAAVALGDLWGIGTLFLVIGVIMGMDPLISQAHGAKDPLKVALAFQRALVVGALFCLPLLVLWKVAPSGLEFFGQEAKLIEPAGRYLWVQWFGGPSFLFFMVMRHYLQGRAIMALPMWIIFAGNLVNVFANWVLIFGHLGFPAMGVEGAGLSTGLTRLSMMVFLVFGIIKWGYHKNGWAPWSRDSFAWSGLKKIVVLGIPVSLQISLELWAFNAAGLMAGGLGAKALAAHVIVVRFAGFSYMLPLGLSFATATRVGNLMGMGMPKRAERAAWVSMTLAGTVMAGFALTFLLGRKWLPRIFTDDQAVIAFAAAALPAAAAFQLFDGIQAVAGASLRGIGRTRPAAIANLVGYWLLGLPLSWWLGYRSGLGLEGIWWGLCLGLFIVAVALSLWVWKRGPRVAKTLT